MDQERPAGDPTGHHRSAHLRRARQWAGLALVVVVTVAGWSLTAPQAAAVPSGWAIVPSANTGAGDTNLLLRDVTCVTPSDCWSVGGVQRGSSDAAPAGLTDHWDGSTWTPVANPLDAGLLTSVTCVSSSDCWATGGTSVSNDNALPVAAAVLHWDGSSWTTAHLPATGEAFSELNGVACSSASSCWAVGGDGPNQATSGLVPGVLPGAVGDGALVEHWDGATWSSTAVPQAPAPDGAYLSGVTCPSAATCFAVGTVMDAAGNPGSAVVDRWDGTRWSSAPVPQPTAGESILDQVACLGPGACWAVGVGGYTSDGNSSPAPTVEAWNGTAWSIEPSPDATALAELAGVTCLPGSGCVATGFTGVSLSDNLVLHSLVEQLTLPPTGSQGALLVAADGGVCSFGDAAFYGSTGAAHLAAPVAGMVATPDGRGYWLVAADGGVFTFGDAAYDGSVPGQGITTHPPVVGLSATPDGGGYWVVDRDGGLYAYGDATFLGALTGDRLDAPVVGMASPAP